MLLLCGYANEGSDRETKGSVYNTQRDFSTTNLVKRVRIIHGLYGICLYCYMRNFL